jgi:hypothetical protein
MQMRSVIQAAVCALAMFTAAAPAAEKSFDFANDTLNAAPSGFTNLVAAGGNPGDWRVIQSDAPSAFQNLSGQSNQRTAQRALSQVSRDATDERFPLLVYEGDVYADFTYTAQVKLVDGEKEQMAGLAFRIQDERNFYYVRASALGNTLYFFKVVGGVRSTPIGTRIDIPKGVWHELAVECRGNQIRVLFNGREAIPTMSDKSFMFGKVGFITKSDTVAHFANARLNYTPREILAQTVLREVQKRHKLEDVLVFSQPARQGEVRVIASHKPEDLGKPATDLERSVLDKGKVFQSKIGKSITMTLPLHDANGDIIAAVRIVMKSFPGETEKTALGRAVPIIRSMENHVRTHDELVN